MPLVGAGPAVGEVGAKVFAGDLTDALGLSAIFSVFGVAAKLITVAEQSSANSATTLRLLMKPETSELDFFMGLCPVILGFSDVKKTMPRRA